MVLNMADMLEGSFNTPVGNVPKKAAVLVGAGLLLLVGVMYYRGKKQDAGSATAEMGDINPATGYAYGSAEDLAALAAQGGTIGPIPGGSSGGGLSDGGNPVGTGFTNNAQWVQSTIAGMVNAGIIEDASALSVALGSYISGQPVGSDSVAHSLISQAIAWNGQPPVAGPNGYPPSINTQNPVHPPAPAPAPYVNPYINPDGTLSIGAGANLTLAAESVGLTLAQLAALNPTKYPSNGTVTAIRGMPYKIK